MKFVGTGGSVKYNSNTIVYVSKWKMTMAIDMIESTPAGNGPQQENIVPGDFSWSADVECYTDNGLANFPLSTLIAGVPYELELKFTATKSFKGAAYISGIESELSSQQVAGHRILFKGTQDGSGNGPEVT